MQTYYCMRKEERDSIIEGLKKALLSVHANADVDYLISIPFDNNSFTITFSSDNLAILSFANAFMFGFRTGAEYGKTLLQP